MKNNFLKFVLPVVLCLAAVVVVLFVYFIHFNYRIQSGLETEFAQKNFYSKVYYVLSRNARYELFAFYVSVAAMVLGYLYGKVKYGRFINFAASIVIFVLFLLSAVRFAAGEGVPSTRNGIIILITDILTPVIVSFCYIFFSRKKIKN